MTDIEQRRYLALVDAALDLQQVGDHQSALDLLAKAQDLAPDYAPIYLLMGVSCQELGRPEDAETKLRKALSLQPEYPEAQQSLGLLLSMRGQWLEAIDLLKTHLEKEPANLVSLRALGTALSRLGRQEEAVRILQGAWQRTEEAKTGVELGRCLIGMRRLEEAETLLRQVIEASESAESLTELAVVLTMQGRCQEAIHSLLQATQRDATFDRAWRGLAYCYRREANLQGALDAAKRALSVNDRHYRNWQIYGDILLALEKPQEALEATRHGLELIVDDEPEARPVLYRLLFQELLLLAITRQFEEALARVEDARQRFPTEGAFPQLQTSLLISLGKYEEALQVLDDAFRVGLPPDGNLAPLRFETLHLLGRSDEAWALIEPTLATHSGQRLGVLGHVGLHVYSQGKVSVAQSIFEQLHVFAPEEPRVANSLGFILTGGGRLSDARELFLHALTRADKPIMRPVILANLGYLYLVEGHLTEAIESLQESASLAAADNKAILRVAYWEDGSVLPDPVPYPTRWLPIWTAVKANQVTLALAQDLVEVAQALAQQIIDEAPDGSWGYAMLGWVLRTKVDFDGARQAWQQALAHTEDQQDRDAIARWLESLPE